MAKPQKITYPYLFGPPVLPAVREKNPNASPEDLRRILGAADEIPRDRLPENPTTDYPSLIQQKWLVGVNPDIYNRPVAIIGAGAAGLCAGYELMKCGLTPVFFEAQKAPNNPDKARPGGRAYSWDFLNVGNDADGKNHKKSVGELGCMRFPKSHTTLRTYVDAVFKGEYSYAEKYDTQWFPFRDPLLVNENNEVVFDTILYARGIKGRQSYRINAKTPIDEFPEELKKVSNAFESLIDSLLSGILKAYQSGDEDEVYRQWTDLNATYQDKSIFEVLRDQKWTEIPAGSTPIESGGASLLDIFGEIGLGSGGFDAFWGTTFMEVLRIKLHQDETNQDAFLGGTEYMLKPFLSHKVACASGKTQSMLDVTNGHVVTNPVARIINLRHEGGSGIRIDCETETPGKFVSYKFPCVILTASPTSISSSIYITEDLFADSVWSGIRNIPLTGCGKVFAAFDEPFWRGAGPNGRDSIVTCVTDEALRQIYVFDDYHWGSGSKAGLLMLSYTWGDWAHKMGSMSEADQVQTVMRMLPNIIGTIEYEPVAELRDAIEAGNIRTINWSHERGFAGGYRMADLNRYKDQTAMSNAGAHPNDSTAPLFLGGEACAWLGLSGWIEGALHTGIHTTLGATLWLNDHPDIDWSQFDKLEDIKGTSFQLPSDPGPVPFPS